MTVDLSIVVPIHNEQDVLPEFYVQMKGLLKGLKEDFPRMDIFEILFVDDGSHDNSVGILASLAHQDECIRYISLSRNFGHQAAVSAGVAYARGQAVVVMDADLQDPPLFIKDMVKKWQEGYPIVHAIRARREATWFLLNFAYKMYYKFQRIVSDDPVCEDSGDFCLMDRKVVDIINHLPEKSRYMRGLRTWVGFKQAVLSYQRPARQKGCSKYSFQKLSGLALQGIMSTSVKPLFLSGWSSVISMLVGLWLIGYVLFSRWVSPEALMPKGWTSLMITITFFSLFQLVSIWLLSLYIAKIYREILARPDYLVAYDSMGGQEQERKT